MVEQVNLNIPSTYNTVRIKRKLEKTNLKTKIFIKDDGKKKKDREKNKNESHHPDKEQQNGIDILA